MTASPNATDLSVLSTIQNGLYRVNLAASLDAMTPRANPIPPEIGDVRERILKVASELFYKNGVRAVGVDLVVERAAVAKSSLYRHFRTKDDLIVAFLAREDVDFWETWDQVATENAGDALTELEAQLRWIGERLGRADYRGCPQINVAAEFAEQDHPAREVARTHMITLRARLATIAQRLQAKAPDTLAAQLALLVNGAFVSTGLLKPEEATDVLLSSMRALVANATRA
jgi:AcrR family transcriptional regulator